MEAQLRNVVYVLEILNFFLFLVRTNPHSVVVQNELPDSLSKKEMESQKLTVSPPSRFNPSSEA